MIPSERRIPKDLHTAPGKFITSSFFTLKISPNKATEQTRFSFSVSKKVASGAVLRNKIRRRGYGALKKHLTHTNPGFLVFFQAKKGVEKASFEEISKQIEDLLVKAKILKLSI